GVHADQPHEHDILREELGERRILHRVAAVLDHDGLARELADVRQRLGENGRFRAGVTDTGIGVRAHDVRRFSSMYAWLRSVVRMVARSAPACRSQVTVIDPSRMTSARRRRSCSAAIPSRHTVTSPYAMSTRSGSNTAPLAPSSDKTRPQYGSLPFNEHCTSWLSATARAASRASSAVRAPCTAISTNFVAPSASSAICTERAMHTRPMASASRE